MDLGDVGNHYRPFGAFQFAQEEFVVGNDADAPAFGVKDLAEGRGADGVVIEHEDADLARLGRLRGRRQFFRIASGEAGGVWKGQMEELRKACRKGRGKEARLMRRDDK